MVIRSGGSKDGSQEAYTIDDVYAKVRRALCGFFESDRDLLEKRANERSITHKLAEHLQCQFKHLDVDCEYNRHGDDIKKLPRLAECIGSDNSKSCKVYPDIIVHQRGNDERNLLVIEAKKSDNKRGIGEDRCKLQEFTNPHGYYKYKFGLLLVFGVGKNKKQVCHVECFKKGRKCKNTVWDCLQGFRGGEWGDEAEDGVAWPRSDW